MVKEKRKKQSQKRDKQILATNMWAVYNFDDPNVRYQRFLSRGRPIFKSFIENVLLYDKVIVPTQDFMSLTLLLGVLGERTLLELLSTNSLKFLRVNGAFCYIGNGGGIKTYNISASNGSLKPFCAPIDEAISWALGGLKEKHKDPALLKAVLDVTTEVKASLFMEEVRHETYMDVLNSNYLRNIFAIRNRNMDHLVGVGPKSVRIYGGPDVDSRKGDEIDTVLLLAATNLEFRLMDEAKCEDLATSNPVGHVLKAKAERCFREQTAVEAFTILREIVDVPDIGHGVLENQVDIKNLLRIKQSRDGEEFRKWFHSHCRGDAKYIAKEYIELLKQLPRIHSLPMRVLRFISTAIIGAIPCAGALLGPVAGVVDSFFLEQWLRGSSPKFFIENLKQISERP